MRRQDSAEEIEHFARSWPVRQKAGVIERFPDFIDPQATSSEETLTDSRIARQAPELAAACAFDLDLPLPQKSSDRGGVVNGKHRRTPPHDTR
jgi:hypothetical protein